MLMLNSGDYVFSLPRVSGHHHPKPLRCAEVVAVTDQRAQLDNGHTVQRHVHTHERVQRYGTGGDDYDFISQPLRAVARADFAQAKALLEAERETLYQMLRLSTQLDRLTRPFTSPAEHEEFQAGLLAQLTALLPQ